MKRQHRFESNPLRWGLFAVALCLLAYSAKLGYMSSKLSKDTTNADAVVLEVAKTQRGPNRVLVEYTAHNGVYRRRLAYDCPTDHLAIGAVLPLRYSRTSPGMAVLLGACADTQLIIKRALFFGVLGFAFLLGSLFGWRLRIETSIARGVKALETKRKY